MVGAAGGWCAILLKSCINAVVRALLKFSIGLDPGSSQRGGGVGNSKDQLVGLVLWGRRESLIVLHGEKRLMALKPVCG
jgi:hypothetical protein